MSVQYAATDSSAYLYAVAYGEAMAFGILAYLVGWAHATSRSRRKAAVSSQRAERTNQRSRQGRRWRHADAPKSDALARATFTRPFSPRHYGSEETVPMLHSSAAAVHEAAVAAAAREAAVIRARPREYRGGQMWRIRQQQRAGASTSR